MTTSIGGSSSSQQPQEPQKSDSANTWTAQLVNIEAFLKNGDKSGAIKQLNGLISTLNAHKPQTSKINAAINQLYAVRSQLQGGAPISAVIMHLQSIGDLLS